MTLEPTIAFHVPYTTETRKIRDILLWKIKAQLADLKVKEIELVHTVTGLEQKAAAAEIFRSSDEPESERIKTLSHQQETSSILIFVDVSKSEESRTLYID